MILAIVGTAIVSGAGLWGIHAIIQDGMTPTDLSTIGMIMLLVGSILFLIFGMRGAGDKTLYELIKEDVNNE